MYTKKLIIHLLFIFGVYLWVGCNSSDKKHTQSIPKITAEELKHQQNDITLVEKEELTTKDSNDIYHFIAPKEGFTEVKLQINHRLAYETQVDSTAASLIIPIHQPETNGLEYKIILQYPAGQWNTKPVNLSCFGRLMIHTRSSFEKWKQVHYQNTGYRAFKNQLDANWARVQSILISFGAALENFRVLARNLQKSDIPGYDSRKLAQVSQEVFTTIVPHLVEIQQGIYNQPFFNELIKNIDEFRQSSTQNTFLNTYLAMKGWIDKAQEHIELNRPLAENLAKLRTSFTNQPQSTKVDWMVASVLAQNRLDVMLNTDLSRQGLFKRLVEVWVQAENKGFAYIEIVIDKDWHKVKKAYLHTHAGNRLAQNLLDNSFQKRFDLQSFRVPKIITWELYPLRKFNLDSNNQIPKSQKQGKAYTHLQAKLQADFLATSILTGDAISYE